MISWLCKKKATDSSGWLLHLEQEINPDPAYKKQLTPWMKKKAIDLYLAGCHNDKAAALVGYAWGVHAKTIWRTVEVMKANNGSTAQKI